jgi:hypothetical protein
MHIQEVQANYKAQLFQLEELKPNENGPSSPGNLFSRKTAKNKK